MNNGTLVRRGDKWYIDWTDATGKRHRKTTGTGDRAVALRVLREEMAAHPQTPEHMTVAFDELVRDLEVREVKSLETTVSHLTPLRQFFQKHRTGDVDEQLVQDYIRWRKKLGRKAGTINKELQLLKQTLKLQQSRRRIRRVPAIKPLPDHAVRTGFFTQEAVNQLLPQLPPHLRDMTQVAFLTGWRLGELRHLRWTDLDFGRKVVTLTGERTKNGSLRSMRVPEAIWALIIRQPREGEYVFNLDGRQIGDFSRTWQRACARAGLEGRLFHDLRRSAVRNMLRAGAPEWATRKVTGHKTRHVMDRYNITGEEEAYEALAKLGA